MSKLAWKFYRVGIIACVMVIWGQIGLADMRRDLPDECVSIGEWQTPLKAGGRGFFLPVDEFAPGKKLAVKIWLEQPEETVTVKFFVETPTSSVFMFKQACQDNSDCDMLPVPNMIVMELIDIPDTPVTRYIVEVADHSGNTPVIRDLETPLEAASLGEHLSETLRATANTLWNLPHAISTALLYSTRSVSDSGDSETTPMHALVIADSTGRILKRTALQGGDIYDPLWLPDQRILFVEQRAQRGRLMTLPDTLHGTPEAFGQPEIEGVEPRLTPDQQYVIFRQETAIMLAKSDGSSVTPLIQDRPVTQLLSVLPDENDARCPLIFSARKPDIALDELWAATLEDAAIRSIAPLPYSSRWLALSAVKQLGDRMVYELQDFTDAGQPVWNIYLIEAQGELGRKLTGDASQDRHPAWSPDGEQIIYVSNQGE